MKRIFQRRHTLAQVLSCRRRDGLINDQNSPRQTSSVRFTTNESGIIIRRVMYGHLTNNSCVSVAYRTVYGKRSLICKEANRNVVCNFSKHHSCRSYNLIKTYSTEWLTSNDITTIIFRYGEALGDGMSLDEWCRAFFPRFYVYHNLIIYGVRYD